MWTGENNEQEVQIKTQGNAKTKFTSENYLESLK